MRPTFAPVEALPREHAPLRTDGVQVDSKPGEEVFARRSEAEIAIHREEPPAVDHGGGQRHAEFAREMVVAKTRATNGLDLPRR